MNSDAQLLVNRLWSYCHSLRDAGLSYDHYVEQLTYLLFLKMADEQVTLLGQAPIVPEGLDWQSLLGKQGTELEAHYVHILQSLGTGAGMLGVVFRKAQNRIQEPAMLRRLIVDLIDRAQWITLDADVKGELYEGLLQKSAEDLKSGAGQYFTPRPLIKAIVEVMRPGPDERIIDPACGTGGFLIAGYEAMAKDPHLDPRQREHLQHEAVRGVEIVDNTARICVMNLLLHGIGHPDAESPIDGGTDALVSSPSTTYSMVLTNPPFGRKSSITITGDDGETDRDSMTYSRQDFWTTTSNKQLNFVQHVRTLLNQNGRAAVVVPDNVLFEGGAGETVRRNLLATCDVHTLLRLPTGIFYRPGVKANVLFFDRKPAAETPWTRDVWVYDFRTNHHFTLKQNALTRDHLDEFVAAYHADNRHDRQETERFHRFTYDEIIARDKANLDIFWLRDDSLEDAASLPSPEVLAQEIAEDLEAALAEFAEIAATLSGRPLPPQG